MAIKLPKNIQKCLQSAKNELGLKPRLQENPRKRPYTKDFRGFKNIHFCAK